MFQGEEDVGGVGFWYCCCCTCAGSYYVKNIGVCNVVGYWGWQIGMYGLGIMMWATGKRKLCRRKIEW